jgi:hypothetical protein
MGYPEAHSQPARRQPLLRRVESDEPAGLLAWHYERDGMMPALIGHSRGGMIVVRTLYEFSGVRDVDRGARSRDRRSAAHDDRRSCHRRGASVIGLKVDYASAIATGKLPRLVLGQWDMLSKLRKISTAPSTSRASPFRSISSPTSEMSIPMSPSVPRGHATLLPASYSHIMIPKTEHLATNPLTRAWIAAYVPASDLPPFPPATASTPRTSCADVWYSVKATGASTRSDRSAHCGARLPVRGRLTLPVRHGRWRDLAPYTGTSRACAAAPRRRFARRDRARADALGLTGFELDRDAERFDYHGGPASVTVDVIGRRRIESRR